MCHWSGGMVGNSKTKCERWFRGTNEQWCWLLSWAHLPSPDDVSCHCNGLMEQGRKELKSKAYQGWEASMNMLTSGWQRKHSTPCTRINKKQTLPEKETTKQPAWNKVRWKGEMTPQCLQQQSSPPAINCDKEKKKKVSDIWALIGYWEKKKIWSDWSL